MQNGGLRINSTPKDGGNTFSGTLLRLRRRQRPAGRQPHRRDEDRAVGDPRSPASPTPGRSTRRSAGRSSATSCGSTSPTSTRTTRPTSPARRSPTAAARSARRRATTARSTRLTWAAPRARQDPLLSRSAVQRRGLQRLQHAADDDARGVDRRVRPRLGAAGQVDADDHRTSCCSKPASRTTRRATSRTAVPRSARATCRGSNRPPTACRWPCGNTIPPYTSWTKSYSGGASASYITGSHAIKTGMTTAVGHQLAHLLVERADQHAGLQRRPARRAGQRHQPGAVHGPAVSDRASSSATRRRRREQKVKSDLGIFVAGHLDDQPADAQSRRPLRPLQRRSAGAVVGGRPLDPGARLPRHPERAELERLVGPSRRRLRPVRQRQDRDQGQRQQVHRVGGRGLRRELQPDDLLRHCRTRAPGSTSTATSRSSTPPATSSSTK